MIIFMIALSIFIVWLMIGVMNAPKNTNISIKGDEVIINSFMYGRKIPIENILIDEIAAVNLNENKELDISYRTNGINIPNFHSGWMKLKNKQKALAFITDKESVLYLPTKDFIILFSMKNTSEFISKLKN
jgi:hypothetical protein